MNLNKLRELATSANGSAAHAQEYISRLRENTIPTAADFQSSDAQKFKRDVSLLSAGALCLGTLGLAVTVTPAVTVGGAAAVAGMLGKTLYHNWKAGQEISHPDAYKDMHGIVSSDLRKNSKAASPWGRLMQTLEGIKSSDFESAASGVLERAYPRQRG